MNDQIDESIPVLTEVISAQDPAPSAAKTKTESHFPFAATANSPTKTVSNKPLVSAIHAAQEVLSQTDFDAMETNKERSISAEEWAQLEQTIRENVLRQVLARVDFVLEHRVTDSLAEVLQTAVDRLADDIRAGLRHSIEEVVTRALTQEIAKIKGSNR